MKTRRSVKNGSSKTQHQEKHKLFSSWLLTRFQFGGAHTYSVKDAGSEVERGIHVLEAARCTQLQSTSATAKTVDACQKGYHFFKECQRIVSSNVQGPVLADGREVLRVHFVEQPVLRECQHARRLGFGRCKVQKQEGRASTKLIHDIT